MTKIADFRRVTRYIELLSDSLEILVLHGADPSKKDRYGETLIDEIKRYIENLNDIIEDYSYTGIEK